MSDTDIFLGAMEDDRPIPEREKDYGLPETVASVATVDWKEKGKNDWRSFPEQEQDGSGSCVAQTIKKLALIMFWLQEKTNEIFSATSIYTNRSNKPSGGMIGIDAFEIWRKKGIALESMVPSHDMNDREMDAVKMSDHDMAVAKQFSIDNHVGIPVRDFETVASVIQQTGKGVMVWFYFTSKEWGQKFPKVLDRSLSRSNALRHSVAAVDFGLIDGKKYIKIEDSSHFGGLTERWISEEFYEARNWLARYPINFKFGESVQPTPETNPSKPSYHFSMPLEFITLNEFGRISDLAKHESQKPAVMALQNILKYEGLFPKNIASTGYFGAVTAKAVYNWQVKHSVASHEELLSLQGRRVGEKTIEKLNSLYS